jgi:hypothetical protein
MKQRLANYQLVASRKKLLKNNVSKFLFFAWALDRLVQYKMFRRAERINIGYIDKSIYTSNLIKESEHPAEDVNRWIQEMIFLGLIICELDNVRDLELVYITEKGIEAYKAQTYHIIAANLLEAEASRKLARRAFYAACVSVAISVIAVCITIYFKS